MATSRIKINLNIDEPAAPAVTVRPKIFNPLDGVSVSSALEDGDFTSLSRITNSDVGVCPKCGKAMGTATIANNDTVFYCEADRVSTPMPNKEG